ncbi:MAG TPA: VIT domain-containing protein [Tepidisphaeraceae bacterium]|jgi:Ca-activated chloride channel family protein
MKSHHLFKRVLLASLTLSLCLLAIVIGCSQAIRPQPQAADRSIDSASQHHQQARPAPSAVAPAPAPAITESVTGSANSLTPESHKESRPDPDTLTSSLAPEDELWVIQKSPMTACPAPEDSVPGAGALLANTSQSKEPLPIPLKHTDVKASIAGYIATVDVTQQYHNPFSEKIEAVYVFPLPANAAVNDFLMTIGTRKIRGIIRERAEAEKIYREARSQGHVASLLTQERPNIFTQSVANIEPGKEIDINIKYFHTLSYADGWYEYHFPMVVGPRFNPPETPDPITPKALESPVGTPGTQIPYLKPAERTGHDISLALHVDAGVAIEDLQSINHRVESKRNSATSADIKLASDDSIPNKDFVLRYKVAGGTLKSALMTQRTEKGENYFTLMVYPPESLNDLPRQPLEMVFTLDVSGSMDGAPLEQSKSAIRYALSHMRPDDTFQIIRFANGAERLSPQSLPATQNNIRQALTFIESTSAGGGTSMIEGIRASLNFPHDEQRLRFVSFLTDGYIGNEAEILREVHTSLGPSRIFSFGVGSSTNRYLLDTMARLGKGAVAYLALNEKGEDVMSHFFDRISHPALTNVSIDWNGLDATDVYPSSAPDLFVGRPIILTGKLKEAKDTTIRLTGKVGGQTKEIQIPVRLSDSSNANPGVTAVWARMKIAQLSDRSLYEPASDLPAQIRQVALDHNLVSQFTSFVAVDSSSRTAGDHGTSVAVPVPVPAGVRYETTVRE